MNYVHVQGKRKYVQSNNGFYATCPIRFGSARKSCPPKRDEKFGGRKLMKENAENGKEEKNP